MFRKIVQFKNGKYGLREYIILDGWQVWDLKFNYMFPNKYGYPWPLDNNRYKEKCEFDSIELLYKAMEECIRLYNTNRKEDIGTPVKVVKPL